MSVAEFVAGVDRLLTRGHGLFPAGGPGEGGQVFAAGAGRGSVPAAPGGDSSLTGGATAAGGAYQQAQAGTASERPLRYLAEVWMIRTWPLAAR